MHPGQEGALPLVGSPASELSGSDTPGPRVRPLGIRAHGALLPETPARKGETPFSPHPRYAVRFAPAGALSMTHGSEKRVRNTHLTIRLSADERAAIDEAAERAGLMPGSYARNTLLGAPAPRQVRTTAGRTPGACAPPGRARQDRRQS